MTSARKKTVRSTGLLVLALIGFVALGKWLPRETTPQQTIEKFESAINRRAYGEISSLMVGGTADLSGFDRLSRYASKDVNCRIRVDSIQVTGDRAVVDTSSTCIDGPSVPNPGTYHYEEVVTLARQSDKNWKIVPQSDWPTRSLVGFFAGLATKPIFANAFWGDVGRPSPPHHALTQESKMKQIATGLLIFIADNNDYLPKSQTSSKKDLFPYLRREDLYSAPESKAILPLFINPALRGKKLASLKKPSETPMLAWGKLGALWFDADGFTYIAFVDGKVEVLDRATAAKLRWNP